LCPAVMRASAMRTASTPAASSPMNVREEPVTPWTMEILPASRLESCARNSVGRRSLISRSLRKASGLADLGLLVRIAASTATSRSPPPPATTMSLPPSSAGREPSRVGADSLPRLHLTLVAFLRDLLVEIERCERVDEVGSEGLGVDLDSSFGEALPMGVGAFAEAGHDADAGDPGL